MILLKTITFAIKKAQEIKQTFMYNETCVCDSNFQKKAQVRFQGNNVYKIKLT